MPCEINPEHILSISWDTEPSGAVKKVTVRLVTGKQAELTGSSAESALSQYLDYTQGRKTLIEEAGQSRRLQSQVVQLLTQNNKLIEANNTLLKKLTEEVLDEGGAIRDALSVDSVTVKRILSAIRRGSLDIALATEDAAGELSDIRYNLNENRK